MSKTLIAGMSLLLLAGCASDPGQPSPGQPSAGQPHKIVSSDADGIRFHFDSARTDLDKLETLASEHCDKYDKEAQPIGVDAAETGLRQANFACVAGQ